MFVLEHAHSNTDKTEEILKISVHIDSLRNDVSARKQDYKHALECLDEISAQVAETAVIITHTLANLIRI